MFFLPESVGGGFFWARAPNYKTSQKCTRIMANLRMSLSSYTLNPLAPNWLRICQGKFRTGSQVEAQGRKVVVPRSAENSSVAWFEFSDLCNKALGAADYLATWGYLEIVFSNFWVR